MSTAHINLISKLANPMSIREFIITVDSKICYCPCAR